MTPIQELLMGIEGGAAIFSLVLSFVALYCIKVASVPNATARLKEVEDRLDRLDKWADNPDWDMAGEKLTELEARLKSLEDWADDDKEWDRLVGRVTAVEDTVNGRHVWMVDEHDHRILVLGQSVAEIEKLLDEWDRREVRAMSMPGCQDSKSYVTVNDAGPGWVEYARHPMPKPQPKPDDREAAITAWIERWGRKPCRFTHSDDYGWTTPGSKFDSGDDDSLPAEVYARLQFGDDDHDRYHSKHFAIDDLRQALGQLHDAGIPFPDCN